MSLRRALQKLRNDGEETEHYQCIEDVASIEQSELQGIGIEDFDFDLNSEFFEQDEYSGVSQFASANGSSDGTKAHRPPLMQVRNQTTDIEDRSSDKLLKRAAPVLSSSLSSQKLKTFSFCRENSRNITNSSVMPPSKKPALEKEVTRHKSNPHTPLNTHLQYSLPNCSPQTNAMTSSTVFPSLTRRSSTPKTTSPEYRNVSMPSLPVTPLSRSASKRKFPGPAGLLPKLLPTQSLNDVKLSIPVSVGVTPRSKVTTLVDLLPSSQGDCCDFTGPVWKSAVKELTSFDSNGAQEITQLLMGRSQDQKGLVLEKVPCLVAMLKSVVLQRNGACVTLKDSTGEIPGTLHSKVCEEYQKELVPGTILMLKKDGTVLVNEKIKESNPLVGQNVLHNSPETSMIPEGDVMDSNELFIADISEEWYKFADTASTATVTSPATNVMTFSQPPVCTSHHAISSAVNYRTSTSCTSSSSTSGAVTYTTQKELVTSKPTVQFTDGLEDLDGLEYEDLDSLLRDFEDCT